MRRASPSLDGSNAATGDPACRVSQTRTAPSRPQVASSASPHPCVCAAQRAEWKVQPPCQRLYMGGANMCIQHQRYRPAGTWPPKPSTAFTMLWWAHVS